MRGSGATRRLFYHPPGPTWTSGSSAELALERPDAVGLDLGDLDRRPVEHPEAVAGPANAVGLLQRAPLDLDGLLDPAPDDGPRVLFGARALVEAEREHGDPADPPGQHRAPQDEHDADDRDRPRHAERVQQG